MQELVRGYVLWDAQVPVMLLVDIHVLRLVTGHVKRHVGHLANATTAQIVAEVVVMVLVMVHVSHLLKAKIQQYLSGKIKNLKIG